MPPRAKVPYLRLLRGLGELTYVYDEIRDTSGPVASVVLGPAWLLPSYVVVTSAEGAREVVADRDGVFDKEALPDQEFRELLGANLFSFANAPWKPRRRTLQPLFTRRHVGSYHTHMAEAAEALADRWVADPGTVDLDEDMRHLTLRVLGRSLFGQPLEDNALDVGPLIKQSLSYITARSSSPARAPDWFPSPRRRRARSARNQLRAHVAGLVALGLEDSSGDGDLIQLLQTATDPETGQTLSPDAVIDELMVFFIAGHDTTATTLTAALWLLGGHPQVQKQVAVEARDIDRPITVDDLGQLPGTIRVIHEAMRLYPPGAVIVRRATQTTSIHGYQIPAGADIIVSTWAIHRHPQLWPDPTRFDPDRFLPHRQKERDRWAYLPFGGGARSCIGDHFAMTEAAIVLASLIRRTEVTSLHDQFPLSAPFTLTANGPIPARVQMRT